MNSPTSISPMDRDRHKPPGQHLNGPIYIEQEHFIIITNYIKNRKLTGISRPSG